MVYDISYKTFFGSKPLHIRFDKVDGFIRVYDGASYLVLFVPEKYDVIYKRIRYLISQKSGITYAFSHNYAKIKVDSYNSKLQNVVILIRSVLNKHCVKSACIRSYSGSYFPAFELNTERYGISLRIQSECGKIWTRITPNTDTFHAGKDKNHYYIIFLEKCSYK